MDRAASLLLRTAVAEARFMERDFFARTLLGQRRNLADLLRLHFAVRRSAGPDCA